MAATEDFYTCLSCGKRIAAISKTLHDLRCQGSAPSTALAQASTLLATSTSASVSSSANSAASMSSSSALGNWSCSMCTLENGEAEDRCAVCAVPRILSSSTVAENAAANAWVCQYCTCENPNNLSLCSVCDSPRLDEFPRPPDAAYRDTLLPVHDGNHVFDGGSGGPTPSRPMVPVVRARINEGHAAALGALAGAAIAVMQGTSVSRGAIAGGSAGLLGSQLLNTLDEQTRVHGIAAAHAQDELEEDSGAFAARPRDFFADFMQRHQLQQRGNLGGDGGAGSSYEALLERFGTGAPRSQATDAQISSLPTRKLNSAANLPSGGCSICMDDFAVGNNVKTMQCLHVFHTACIDQWLHESLMCPVCKNPVT